MENLLQKINELYDLQLGLLEKVTIGFISENHILTGGDKKYFLKKYAFNNEEKVRGVHLAKKYFSEKGVPVIAPLTNKTGETFFSFEESFFALFPFVEGRQIKRELLTDTAIISMGQTLAKIHQTGQGATISTKEQFGSWDKDKFIVKRNLLIETIEQKEDLDDFDKLALLDVKFRGSLIEKNTTTVESLGLKNDCLIHGDYLDQNVFFNADEKVSNVFDFEAAKYAPRVFELIRSTMLMFFDNTVDSEAIVRARAYLNSYRAEYPISTEELQRGLTLYYLRMLHGFWVQDEHYLKQNYRVDQFLESRYKSIQYLSEHLDELSTALFD